MQGRPARVPAPWIERKISAMVMMPLAAPGRGFSTLAPLDKNHRRDNYNRRHHKPKWLDCIPKPMKHEDVAQSHGNGRQNDDEKGTVHTNHDPLKSSRSPKSCRSPRP